MLQELKGLIAANKTREAIAKMAQIIGDKDADLLNNIIMISAQMSSNESLFSMRLIGVEEYNKTTAMTMRGILATLDELAQSAYFDAISDVEKPTNTVIKIDNRIKIQFLGSNPSNLTRLQLEREYIEIRKIFKHHQEKFALTEEFDVTLDSFFEAIYLQKAKIIHFAGYSEEGFLILNRKNGGYQCVSFEYLAATFKLFRDYVECVFINAMYSDIFAKVVSRFIPNVIGIKGMIMDRDAITFASGFYTAVSFEKDYAKAFIKAKDFLISERMNALTPLPDAHIPTSYGIGKGAKKMTKEETEKVREAEIEDIKNIPYVMFSNGEPIHENDTTPDDFFEKEVKKEESITR